MGRYNRISLEIASHEWVLADNTRKPRILKSNLKYLSQGGGKRKKKGGNLFLLFPLKVRSFFVEAQKINSYKVAFVAILFVCHNKYIFCGNFMN